MAMKILVTGGSGYLGQWLTESLAQCKVVYTYHSRPLPVALGTAVACKVDLTSCGPGSSLAALFQEHGPFDVVINTAALSQPAACQKDPAAARAVNIPTALVSELNAQCQRAGRRPLLIHLSTDQVYDGSKAWWKEEDACQPVNVYGQTKLEAEQHLQEAYQGDCLILRSSIIIGPQPTNPVPRTVFTQFLDETLASGKPASFFSDEWRCPIYAQDIVRIVAAAIGQWQQYPEKWSGCRVLNMGGPERLSRVDMAHKVAEVRGYDPSLITAAPSPGVASGASPADISMDTSALTAALGIQLTSFSEALKHMWRVEDKTAST